MKKFALISAILFFIVYFWANTFMPEDDSGVGIYPVVAANPVTETNIIDEALLNRIMEAEAPAETEAPSGESAPSEAVALSGAVASVGSCCTIRNCYPIRSYLGTRWRLLSDRGKLQ
ncbi:MAG: hypothetical protein MZV63_12595 [Marinilabiliales bacterium]|nr:hypothetical protein [Marinilabiliales bacterium]